MKAHITEKLAGGRPVTMVNIHQPSAALVEQVAKLGFDVAFIDCEKGSASYEQIQEMARAARAGGIATVVRPWINDPGLISRYLDLGADGIMAASIDDPAAARGIVEAVRYARWQDHADKLVLAIVESPLAVDNLPAMLPIEGIDAWFVGPNDLAHRMGMPGRASHPDARAVADRALKTIIDGGRTAGMLATRDDMSRLLAMGVRWLLTGTNTLLAQGAGDFRRLIDGKA